MAPLDASLATPDSIIDACGGAPLDVLVISYLLIYCTSERTADLLTALLVERDEPARVCVCACARVCVCVCVSSPESSPRTYIIIERSFAWCARFRRRVKALLISERTHEQEIVPMLKRRNLEVITLMPQRPLDHRQLLVLAPGTRRNPKSNPDPSRVTFPNVPFAKGT